MGNTFGFGQGTELTKAVEYNPWTNYKVTELARGLVMPHKLLYVCKSGSRLHGTDTVDSDVDVKGLFLPSNESCFLGNPPKHFKYSTGDDSTRNGKEDIDLELWSVQHWLDLCAKGDSNALSVLFSTFNMDMVIWADRSMSDLLVNYDKLYDPTNVESFIGFAKGQVLKYGLKGTRLQLIENVIQYLVDEGDRLGFNPDTRLNEIDLAKMVESCHTDVSLEKGYLELETIDSTTFVSVLTKKYQDTVTISHFHERMTMETSKYGRRSHEAKDLDGSDWKALSHSLRCMFEANELLMKGHVSYPLASAQVLLNVKRGEVSLEEYEEAYNNMRDRVDKMKLETDMTNDMDVVSKQKVILNLYRKVQSNDGET